MYLYLKNIIINSQISQQKKYIIYKLYVKWKPNILSMSSFIHTSINTTIKKVYAVSDHNKCNNVF